ncbi:MAG: sulfatase-like hydrolase/transferase [Verrucomicrobia bacterium]|jgi:hypothetical protein|nr:sulfatase-like hydrolase/transferase [Verrucomicrobiota bacterium]MBT7068537.1 sulfatase-like hydrolase/transferase [Verrucomicrobiota bacterium]MBT7698944.1 sulfatase-like hydrolase/transferase [Verrucomicrobiota bacterium]
MKKRPNILFLQTDQHRFDALGCVNSLVKTPRLDALAAKGIRFTEAICNNLYDDDTCLKIRETLTRHLLLHMAIAGSRFSRPYSYTDID